MFEIWIPRPDDPKKLFLYGAYYDVKEAARFGDYLFDNSGIGIAIDVGRTTPQERQWS